MLPLLLTAGAVVLISAFCSLCEAVLYALPATHIAKLKEEDHPAGRRLEALRENIDQPITAILTVNTVANTAGAAVAGSLATKALGDGNVVLFSAALTIAILLFSEIVPKTIGVVYTRGLAPHLALPLSAMVWSLRPAILLISFVTRLIARDQEEGVSQEEIVSMARLGKRSGAIDAGEAAVIQNILHLPNVPARRIMTPRTVVFALDVASTVAEALEKKQLMVHSRMPVYAERVDDIVGMVFRRDVLAADDPDTPLQQLIRPVHFVGQQEPVDRTLELMLEHKRHMLVVVDEFGGFAGVVTLEDVLEEILGEEIMDEFDQVADMRALAIQRRTAALERMGR
jgi:CBS domain containing-hemolysin-like protein